jgi:hypothetical protein
MSKAASSRGAKPAEHLPAFPEYFASSQRNVDIFQSVFILTLGQACQCIRVVQIAVCDSAAPAAAPATLSGFPCDSGELEQGLWVLARFPWLAWVLARDFYWFELPWTVVLESVILVAAILQPRWYLQGGRTILYPLLRIGIAALVFLEMLLAPTNPILLATASVCFLGLKGILFLFFAVLCKVPTHLPLLPAMQGPLHVLCPVTINASILPDHASQRAAWNTMLQVFSRAPLTTIAHVMLRRRTSPPPPQRPRCCLLLRALWPLRMSLGVVQNTPLWLHALTCTCAWLFMALYNLTYCYKHGGSMPGVLVNILTAQLVIGVAVPVLVARFQTRSLWARYRALQVCPTTWQHLKHSGSCWSPDLRDAVRGVLRTALAGSLPSEFATTQRRTCTHHLLRMRHAPACLSRCCTGHEAGGGQG